MAWKVLLVVASILPGLAFGAWLGAQFLVPRDAGLAAGAMVLWYGLLGGLVAVIGAVLLVRYLAGPRLRVTALFMAGVSFVLLVWLTLSFAEMGTERAEHRRQAVAMLPAFELALTGQLEPGLRRFTYTSQNNDWRIEKMDGTRCQGGLPEGKAGNKARVELLSALRGLDVAGVLAAPPGCQQTGELLAMLAMRIHEAKPPPTEGSLSLTTACRGEIPEIAALLERVESVYRIYQKSLVCD
ncbi:cytochrome d ubiquinol oxidase subunit II [Wenzhouxiangella sp. XN24]|uniref:cytochrome d ubiquinol oxidase subunit II n=1 Tax=Wenzhouxiangella sp. XN24 TaxID=2713569 RepID=UPI0013EA776B|nr:cytochrome d ubiquinol oxidase subunit II [Wenzhouxiangella sp. XN24]NGX16328.1 cytochrome d ubiquinol oxidase subunit II [Wenzhouxiangella sp. XN24]